MSTHFPSNSKSIYKLTKANILKSFYIYSGIKKGKLEKPLSDLIIHLIKGLNGDLNPNFYLSSIDPGLGKTECYCSFLKSWKELRFLPGGSALIAVSTIDEIQPLIDRSGLGVADYACLTSDKDINALGRGAHDSNHAAVLFTTHAMIRSRTSDRSFAAADIFHFEGKPRTLRIWDEAFVLAKECVLSLDALHGLLAAIRHRDTLMASMLEDLIAAMNAGTPDDMIAIPSDIGTVAKAVLARGDSRAKIHRTTLEKLVYVAGRTMTLNLRGGRSDRALIGSSRSLPADFAPAIITDASGRVRGTYKAQEAGAGNLVRLLPYVRDYSAVKMNVCPTACGKDALSNADRREAMVRAAAKVMNEDPSKEWLLISYLRNADFDIEQELRLSVNYNHRVSFLNWGRHHGTNDYKNVRNIMIIGGHMYGNDAYPALELAASGCNPATFVPSVSDFKKRELMHNTLQAVMRGNARNGAGKDAGQCDVYMFASPNPDPLKWIEGALPGCKIVRWNALSIKPNEVGRRVIEAAKNAFNDNSVMSVPKAEIRKMAGILSASNLSRAVSDYRVRDALGKLGIITDMRNFRRSA